MKSLYEYIEAKINAIFINPKTQSNNSVVRRNYTAALANYKKSILTKLEYLGANREKLSRTEIKAICSETKFFILNNIKSANAKTKNHAKLSLP